MREPEELVRKHDDYQFELKLDYDLDRDRAEDRYRVETFFFLPNNLDVNESTYSKKQFYRDLLLYIRFKTPAFSLPELADPGHTRSPLFKIRAKMEEPSLNAAGLEYEIKLEGCVLKSALRESALRVERALREPGGAEEASRVLRDYPRQVRDAARAFRALGGLFRPGGVPERLRSAYAFTDEYISLLIEGSAHRLLRLLGGPGAEALFPEFGPALADLIREENRYRRDTGYPSLADEADAEVFLFRLGVLKKYVSSILHLSVRTEEEGRGLKEFALAAAAGIAMVFAASVALYYQKKYGAVSLSFFAALVVSYMFKDRIKAFFQHYFEVLLSKRLFDQQTTLHDPFTGARLGLCRESARFVPEDGVDPRVLSLRDRDHITEIENDFRAERVISYVKEISLRPRSAGQTESRKTALTDITRFNVRSFLLKMDQPQAEIFRLNGGRSEVASGRRVYHVNLVIKFSSGGESRYERARLVLTRDGIKRVEAAGREIVAPPPARGESRAG
jgi:hypothetical protein